MGFQSLTFLTAVGDSGHVIQIRLSHLRPDGGGGWYPGITAKQAWNAARTAKPFKPDRVLRQRAQVIGPDGTVLAVANIRSVTATDSPKLVTLDGPLITTDPLIGKQTPSPHPPRRLFIYVDDDQEV